MSCGMDELQRSIYADRFLLAVYTRQRTARKDCFAGLAGPAVGSNFRGYSITY